MTDDLHRTNINLYAKDVEWLRNKYGYGWTEKARDIIHDYISHIEQINSQGYSVTEFLHRIPRDD